MGYAVRLRIPAPHPPVPYATQRFQAFQPTKRQKV